MSRRQALDHYLSVVRECLETEFASGAIWRILPVRISMALFIPFCLELEKFGKEYGIPVKIRACDTMGFGVNFTGAAIPRSVPGIIYGLNTMAAYPSEMIERHGIMIFCKGGFNSTTAWLYGACGVNCSLFGIGERTGNTPLEAMWF